MKKLIELKEMVQDIQDYADLHFEGNFSMAVRKLIKEGLTHA